MRSLLRIVSTICMIVLVADTLLGAQVRAPRKRLGAAAIERR
jgi:hypothetical protein